MANILKRWNGGSWVTIIDADNLNATSLTSGTTPSARVTGSYTGITDVGTLTGLTVSGNITLTGTTSNVIFANGQTVGIQNTSGDAFLHLDRPTFGSALWRARAGSSTFIDALSISLRSRDGVTTYFTTGSTGSSVTNNINITSAGNSTSSLVNNAGALEVRGGTNVVLSPSASGRIVTGRGKNTLQMTGFTNLVPSTDVILTNSGTDMINGISVTSMENGDVLDIRALLRMQRTTSTTSSVTIVVNVAGPGGNTNLPGRIIYADGTVLHDLDHTHTGQWLYTCALGAGTYTVKVFGFGFAANVWKMLAAGGNNDSVLSVATYSMR